MMRRYIWRDGKRKREKEKKKKKKNAQSPNPERGLCWWSSASLPPFVSDCRTFCCSYRSVKLSASFLSFALLGVHYGRHRQLLIKHTHTLGCGGEIAFVRLPLQFRLPTGRTRDIISFLLLLSWRVKMSESVHVRIVPRVHVSLHWSRTIRSRYWTWWSRFLGARRMKDERECRGVERRRRRRRHFEFWICFGWEPCGSFDITQSVFPTWCAASRRKYLLDMERKEERKEEVEYCTTEVRSEEDMRSRREWKGLNFVALGQRRALSTDRRADGRLSLIPCFLVGSSRRKWSSCFSRLPPSSIHCLDSIGNVER